MFTFLSWSFMSLTKRWDGLLDFLLFHFIIIMLDFSHIFLQDASRPSQGLYSMKVTLRYEDYLKEWYLCGTYQKKM